MRRLGGACRIDVVADRHVVSFAVEVIRPCGYAPYARIMPMVDARPLTDWFSDDCGPVVPSHFRLGDLHHYFLGRGSWPLDDDGRPALLWCECGDAGCDPVTAEITVTDGLVVWSGMRSGVAPMAFDAGQYQEALHSMIQELESTGTLPDYPPYGSEV
jgi:hypothetical protein